MIKERHYAFKITSHPSGLVCTKAEFEEDKMLDLLKGLQNKPDLGIYWILKQLGSKEPEPLCLIDCYHNRIYYHYSGEVEDVATMIKKLSKKGG